MGHIVVLDDSAAQLALTTYSRQLWHDLASTAPPAVEYEACGTLWVAADAEEMGEVDRKCTAYTAGGIATELWVTADLHREEPYLRPDLVGGLCVLEDAVIYPPAATVFLLEEARRSGVEVRTRTAVKALLPGGRVCLADGGEIHAGAIVNAAGCAAPALTGDLPIRPRKGHLAITERYRQFARHQIIELGYLKSAHAVESDSVAFNIQPRSTGQILIGSSRQFASDQSDVEFTMLRRMLNRACEYMPSLDGLSVLRCWTGFRPATPDKLPYVGPHPQHERLWIAAGHEGLGITTSLATGQILADLLTGRTPAIPVEPYLPERLWKQEACDV
jgi:glycine/D-amino acid oxidase-like deaminating enzyme